MSDNLESAIRMFREQLFKVFYDWADKNRKAIGEKWYSFLTTKGKDAENECDTAIRIIGTSMWMFNMIANLGVSAGLGPDGPKIHEIAQEIDVQSTQRLLHLMAACMNLQYLPKEIGFKPFPIIGSKRFSLKLWLQETT